ncbi:reverse gyrase [Hydrogenivirga sp. 128-5-R1-1]|uniref:reverse gyrase n=1 Tax=Hydrogenivirga sp. 128-5-R1-1 TaxID=392423 RepID=UPI00015EF768|nr:reverse gyrase [Hydrogenivirga sp. 128-5-R1-1]EDP75676.1 reverse gyrase [Hydrogenivirga sp. 128-5-R1-1]
MISALFEKLCPNCGGDISSERLLKGLPCDSCLPEEVPREKLCEALREGSLKGLCDINSLTDRWELFFKEKVGSDPWSLQRSWAKKVFLKRSFALLAPTGVGKTTFGVVTASFLVREGGRSYIILPTKLLLEQVQKKLVEAGVSEEELVVASDTTAKRKKETKERISRGDFRVLVTTSMYLYKNFELIPKDFNLIFVDDVDSFLKTAKNIDKVLYLLGFTEDEVQRAYELVRLKDKRNKTKEDWELIRRESEEVARLSEKARGVLVVSSATGNPRSSRIKLFRELLGFEVGRPTVYLRNVADLYEEVDDMESALVSRVKELGSGGLIFVSSDVGREGVERVVKLLRKAKVKAKSYEEVKDFSEFEKGKVQVLVGISSYRNPLVRGLDLPHVVRYALFYGVPKITVSLSIETSVSHLLWALLSIRPSVAKEIREKVREVDRWIQTLRRYSFISEDFIERTPDLKKRIENLREEIKKFLLSEEIKSLIENSEELTLRKSEGGYTIVVADVTGYLQASGRTSRMFAGGITKGLSYILVDDRRALNNLLRKIRWFNEEVKFLPAEEVNLKELLAEIDTDREKVRAILEGRESIERKEHIRPVLIVVESPNKARTIANFFGKPISRRFGEFETLEIAAGDLYLMITSSLGHILDLTKEEGFHGVVVKDGDFVPVYEVIEGKEKTTEGLRQISQEVDTVYVATDPDTEGEKIGWDVGSLLAPFVRDVKRIEFHEVTRRAIGRALSEPRDFNENLVKAQIVRRISDRWVGFEVSRILQSTFQKVWLSGGRVQIPVLGWIIEREKEYRKKRHVVLITFKGEGRWLRLEFELPDKKRAKEFYEKLKAVEVDVLEERVEELSPPPPFTTDTLLKEASDRFKFGVKKTMQLAQELFEKGFITYHRTDSTRVSDTGIGVAREFIKENLSENLFNPRRWGSEGAHECIRPSRPLDSEELRSVVLSGQVQELSRDHISLYDLIFRRFMASQMKPAKVKSVKVSVKALGLEQELTLRTEIVEDGFNLVYQVELHPELRGTVDVSDLKELRELPRAYLFTQGSLVQEMKRRGIGRPSTYASTVEKLLDRGYVIERSGFLIPTKLGKEIYEFLKKQEKILPFVSESFTRKLEELMDSIEEGKEDHKNILKLLYKDIIEFEASVRR